MSEIDDTEKPRKLSRNELLAKAREAKARRAEERKKETAAEVDVIINEAEKKVKRTTKPKKVIEVKEIPLKKEEEEPEIVEEVVRIPANRKKKIVKRTIEIEESETDEEIQEEIIKIPKAKKEVKINRDEVKQKLIDANKGRLMNELFS